MFQQILVVFPHFCTMRISPKLFFVFAMFNATLLIVVLAVHFWPGNTSMMNMHNWPFALAENGISETYLTEVVEYHESEPTFARRVVTTKSIRFLAAFLGLTLGMSFVLFNFTMLFLAGFTLCILALKVAKNVRFAFLSGLLFWLSFPILFAFFPTIYSYDDPAQYFFLALTFLAFVDEKYMWSAVFYTLSLFIRESGLILLPGIFVLANGGFSLKNIKRSIEKWGPFLVLSLVFVAGLFAVQYGLQNQDLVQDSTNRFSALRFNFQDEQFAIETIFSFALVCLLATALFAYKIKSRWFKPFLVTLILNTLVVVFFTQARESRLFILPLFFWFPLAGEMLIQAVNEMQLTWQKNKMRFLSVALFAAMFAAAASYFVYLPTAMKPHENWHQEYLFILLTFVLVLSINSFFNFKKNKL